MKRTEMIMYLKLKESNFDCSVYFDEIELFDNDYNFKLLGKYIFSINKNIFKHNLKLQRNYIGKHFQQLYYILEVK